MPVIVGSVTMLNDLTTAGVRLFPVERRDMVPAAVAWAEAIEEDVAALPLTVLTRQGRVSLAAVVWVLAAASDYDHTIPGEFTAAVLAAQAGVGDRVWQKRTAWLRAQGWLGHGPGGHRAGWVLTRRGGDLAEHLR